jgi:hypothetical protein
MRRLIAWLMLLGGLLPTAAQADWLRGESPNFIVYSEGSESRLRDRIILLENYDSLLRLFTGIEAPPAPAKLHVYIVRGEEDLRRIRPVRTGTAGFYAATAHGIAAIVDGRVDGRANEVLFHEYAHHFMMQYAARAYPAWYVEGFAEYFSTADFRGDEVHVGKFSPQRIYAIVDSDWLPMDRILFGDSNGMNAMATARFYAQSWLATHYFFSDSDRQAALRRYLMSERRDDPAAAFEAATGLGAEDLGEALRDYVGDRRISYMRLGRPAAAPPPVTVTRLPGVADELMLHHAALRIGLIDEGRDETLHAIRTTALRHGDDPFARRVLAHAEAVHGDAAAADRLLEALLAESPLDAELLYLKGMRHLRAAEEGEDWDSEANAARGWFARAHRADENHFPTLYRYAQSLRSEQAFVSENNANVLLLAHQLAPQVTEIRMNAAMLMISRGDRELAESLLEPLAADPHDKSLADAARQMIEQARSGEAGPEASPATAARPDVED